MFLLVLLFLSMMAVASSAAYFSVIGLAKLFSGSFISVLIMGGSLEFGKIVITSYLYNYWKETSLFLKTYLVITIFILVCITSMGISGYLMSAHQTTTISVQQDEESLIILEDQLQTHKDRKLDIDKQIASVGDNYVTAKQRLMESFKVELAQLSTDIPFTEKQILEIKTKNVEESAKIGPIIFITEVFGIEQDKAMTILILIIVFVFDPFAIALTIAFNNVLKHRKRRVAVVGIDVDSNDVKSKAMSRFIQEV
jgi:hypothetical protein